MAEAVQNQIDNLDLSNIPNEDVDTLARTIESFYKHDSIVKSRLSYHWERIHLMLDGMQWIVFEGNRETGGLWKPIKVAKENEYIPRPVTNYLFDAYQTLKSYILKNKPRSTVRPNSQTHQDKTAAKIANLVVEANYERLREAANYEYAASCLVTYGNVFKKDYWDTTSVSKARLPKMQMVPKTDPMTGEIIGQDEQPVLDEFGNPVYEDVPLGDVASSVVEPYRIALDPIASDLHTARWLIEYSVQSLDWIRQTYNKLEEGYTGLVDEVKEEVNLSNSMRRWYELKTSTGVSTGTGGMTPFSTSGGRDTMIKNAAVVKEYYERPSQLYPKGRLIVVANGITLYAGDSPCQGPDMGDWHPYSECRWELVPGRFWGKGPLDEAADIQKIINSIDAVIILTRKTMAIPQKLIPSTSGIEPGTWTGRPGQEIKWRDTGSGARPEIIPAASVHESVFKEREQRVEDLKNITGAIDILKGDRPPGVTAASALNMLYEVGTGKLFPMLDRWKMFIESSQKKQLRLVAHKYNEPREDFIRLLKLKNKELSAQEIDRFIGEDLYDNCNVTIEAGSNIPKLQAAGQAMLLEVANTGALNLQLPENRQEFLERLGINGFDNDIGPDLKRASWENDLLDNLPNDPQNHPVVLDVDNHEVHIHCHSNRMKEPAFMSLPGEVQQAYMQHIAEHEQFSQMQKQMAQLEAMQTGQPPAPSGPQESALVSAGKGVSTDMKARLFNDTNIPGEG